MRRPQGNLCSHLTHCSETKATIVFKIICSCFQGVLAIDFIKEFQSTDFLYPFSSHLPFQHIWKIFMLSIFCNFPINTPPVCSAVSMHTSDALPATSDMHGNMTEWLSASILVWLAMLNKGQILIVSKLIYQSLKHVACTSIQIIWPLKNSCYYM